MPGFVTKMSCVRRPLLVSLCRLECLCERDTSSSNPERHKQWAVRTQDIFVTKPGMKEV